MMHTEMSVLAWAVALTLAQLLVSILGAMTQFPLARLVGNREPPTEGTGWVGRAQRAHRNMLESLLPFAAVVLVANATATSNAITLLGAQLFLYARVAYALLYVAGVPWLRTIAWTAGLAGILLVLSQVLGV